MEELRNIPLDWNMLLDKQIKLMEESTGNKKSSELFAPLIDMLNNNIIPSKVILNKGIAKCYGYMVPNIGIDDRILGSIGFLDQSYENDKNVEILLSWFMEFSRSNRMLLIIDGVYGSKNFEKYALSKGFKISVRRKLVSTLSDLERRFQELNVDEPENYGLLLKNSEISLDELCEIEEKSYGLSEDRFLLIRKGDKNVTAEIIMNGFYGKILDNASFNLHRQKIIGSIQVTDGYTELFRMGTPLVVDLFVAPGERRKGLASALFKKAVDRLISSNFTEVQLWVNVNSEAYKFYEKLGFQSAGEEDVMYHIDFRAHIS